MEDSIRLGVFAFVFFCVASAEFLWPCRKLILGRKRRWPSNISVALLNMLLVRLIVPITLAGFAEIVARNHWGMLALFDGHWAIKILFSIILLDLVIYAQHVVFHCIPVLWRLHRVHHADTEIDVTTALRFHPVEILISLAIKFAAVAVIGVSTEAILLFEIILNACAMFNHGNVHLPPVIDKVLRFFLVTPDMHRVHHSVVVKETNSNFGFNISLWDRLFRTYCPQPEAGHLQMMIGLKEFREPDEIGIHKILTQPFRTPRRISHNC